MNDAESPSQARLIGWMAVFVLAGIPFVAILWEALNSLLALQMDSRMLVAIPAAVLLAVILYFLKRAIMRHRFRAAGGHASSK